MSDNLNILKAISTDTEYVFRSLEIEPIFIITTTDNICTIISGLHLKSQLYTGVFNLINDSDKTKNYLSNFKNVNTLCTSIYKSINEYPFKTWKILLDDCIYDLYIRPNLYSEIIVIN